LFLLLLLLLSAPPAAPQGRQPAQPLDEIVRHFAEKESNTPPRISSTTIS
jgi:hypothetical protein